MNGFSTFSKVNKEKDSNNTNTNNSNSNNNSNKSKNRNSNSNNNLNLISSEENLNKSIKSFNNNYCSIHQINSNNQNNYQSPVEKDNTIHTNQQTISGKITKKFCAYLLLEINNLIFSSKELFKSIYPELNLMMLIDFNDQVNMQEKIFFNKSDKENNNYINNNIYYPTLRKDELEKKQYRIGKFFEINFNENFIFKIKILLYTYTNHRILPIGSEDIYLKVSPNFQFPEIKKFHMYQNIHQSYIGKKIGNLNFDLTYKIDEFDYHQIIEERNILFNELGEFKKFSKFEEEHKILYKIQERIKEENPINNNNLNSNELSIPQINKKMENYLSINDLEENSTNLLELYLHKDFSCEDLYTLIKKEKGNRRFYILLKKLYNDINKMEFTIKKLNKFRNLLNKKLSEIYEKNDFANELIISLMFDIIKKSYYLQKKDKHMINSSFNFGVKSGKNLVAKMLNFSNVKIDEGDISNNNLNNSKDFIEDYETFVGEESMILEESLNLAFKFLIISKKNDSSSSTDISNNNKEYRLDTLISEEKKRKSGTPTNASSNKEKTVIFLLSKNNNNKKLKSCNKINNNNNNEEANNNNNTIQQNEISINCINFLHKFINDPIEYTNTNQIPTTTENYLYNYIDTNELTKLLIENIFSFASFQSCVDPTLDILLNLFKLSKNFQSKFLTEIKNSTIFYEATKKILKVHDCNMRIMTKILTMIFYLKQEEFLNLLNILKLKNIFLIFRNVNFDLIHEVVLHLIKNLVVNRINDFHNKNNENENDNDNIDVNFFNNNNDKSINLNTSKNIKIEKIEKNKSKELINININNNNNNYFNQNQNKKSLSLNNLINNNNSEKKNTKKSKLNTSKENLLTSKAIKPIGNNNNNNNPFEDLNFANTLPTNKKIVEINAELFSIEELNDILSIYFPTLCVIKAKLLSKEVSKNSKLYFKFINYLEIIGFIILTLISSRENINRLKLLIYFKIIENMVTLVNINTNRGIYRDVHLFFLNKNYLMIGNKIKIIKSFYYLNCIINQITEKGLNDKDIKFRKCISDFRDFNRSIVFNENYDPDNMIKNMKEFYKDLHNDDDFQIKQKIKQLEILKDYVKDMKRKFLRLNK